MIKSDQRRIRVVNAEIQIVLHFFFAFAHSCLIFGQSYFSFHTKYKFPLLFHSILPKLILFFKKKKKGTHRKTTPTPHI